MITMNRDRPGPVPAGGPLHCCVNHRIIMGRGQPDLVTQSPRLVTQPPGLSDGRSCSVAVTVTFRVKFRVVARFQLPAAPGRRWQLTESDSLNINRRPSPRVRPRGGYSSLLSLEYIPACPLGSVPPGPHPRARGEIFKLSL